MIFFKIKKKPFSRNCVKNFDCQAFSLFKTVRGYWAFSHCVVFLLPKTRSHKYAPMDSVFRSHTNKAEKTYHYRSETMKYVQLWRKCTCFCFRFLRFTWLDLTWRHVTSRHFTSGMYVLSLFYSSLKTPKTNLLISICWFLRIEIF